MTRKTITKYWCDNECGKNIIREADENGVSNFPFDAGWVELNQLNMQYAKKSGATTGANIKDKEFCSRNCMMMWMEQGMTVADSRVQEPRTTEELPPVPPIAQRRMGMTQPEGVRMGNMGHPLPPGYSAEQLDNLPPLDEMPPKAAEKPKKRGWFG